MNFSNHLEVKKQFNRGKQLKFAREFRGYSQTNLCKKIKGLSQSNLSKYEKLGIGLSDKKIDEIMKFLNFPFQFLDKTIHKVELSWDL
ncbi:helix-turn-helix transcriptional regulator [Empedobacter sp. GD03739]|uniref:helix-turn-helix domain-containing protein n=1 Tax=Empedobacter sp. GD03739 TaxID=2975376 RepID=UPI00244AAE9B|nr:helix-turn-helix transcriptional regulator [Empedobacter sp. GD03739]MDH1602353.1 helix-turn-helix domain-containing protein [Empedobacter sp. GD03739]